MPKTYKTPGVYTEEISTLPPSVAEVSTAIPAFLGYTQWASKTSEGGTDLTNVPTRIHTMLEYEQWFGGAHPTRFTATVGADGAIAVSKDSGNNDYLLYYSLKLFFDNGGGACYIVSLGGYSDTPNKDDYATGLAALATEDEPTLILLTDAVNLTTKGDYGGVCVKALAQCETLRDRFCIFDVPAGDGKVEAFRTDIGTSDLKYGAAYYPYLQTTLNAVYKDSGVTVPKNGAPAAEASAPAVKAKEVVPADGAGTPSYTTGPNGLKVTYSGPAEEPKVAVQKGGASIAFQVDNNGKLTIRGVGNDGKPASEIADAWDTWKTDSSNKSKGFDIVKKGKGSQSIKAKSATALSGPEPPADDPPAPPTGSPTLDSYKATKTALYNQIKTELAKQRVVLPPSAAMAGIYARVDRQRGVWKAPANVSVASVIGPTVKVTSGDQEALNVDTDAGKSINVIRSFSGKGTLVWGARTLAGNDNEWRYVNVRRLFIMIEESVLKATAFAVFEANDAGTWLKVKAMIDAFLTGLWEQGALAGSTPETAFYVNVGLGKTMTAQDVLEGRMIVEIGVAAVRPAEFIVLNFSHKMQEA